MTTRWKQRATNTRFSESLTGCSFSKEIAYSIGEAQAKLAGSVGFKGWYGPGVNLHRSVYNSRNYEYYSEDAVLSGKLAANTIAAAYDNNMYCYLKHFAVSEAGINPKNLHMAYGADFKGNLSPPV